MAAYFVVNDTTLFNRPWNYTTSRDATQLLARAATAEPIRLRPTD